MSVKAVRDLIVGGGPSASRGGQSRDNLNRLMANISNKVMPMLSLVRRSSGVGHGDVDGRGGGGGGDDDLSVGGRASAHGDRDPHAVMVREICKNLHSRFVVIAQTQTTEEVKEAGVQMVVALEKFRVKTSDRLIGGDAANASSGAAGETMDPDAAHVNARPSGSVAAGPGVSPLIVPRQSTFDRAMNSRMAELVERNDQEDIVKVDRPSPPTETHPTLLVLPSVAFNRHHLV